MYAKELKTLLGFTLENNFPVLIKGAPGIGKSDIVEQVCKEKGWKLVISHPVVADPTDYKGLPFASKDKSGIDVAHFLPFGELIQLIETKEPLVYFLDDLGQATPAVQSAVMQLLLARRINGHRISSLVRFIAATNRREDKANVSGILEPVKSRFASIVELEVKTDDWIAWAAENSMPFELISFIQFRPELLNNFNPTRDIENSPCPRTVAYVGKMWNAGIPSGMQFEVIKGAAGKEFASEFTAFIKVYMTLPTINEILRDPINARLPENISGRYAITGAIADSMSEENIKSFMIYLERMDNELVVACLKMACIKSPEICSTMAFMKWAEKNSDLFI
jgi:hypothetical protein